MKDRIRTDHEAQPWAAADRPVNGRADDKLNRGRFAEAIASTIQGWHGKDSLVIALYGSWGTGKSSLKNMIIETTQQAVDPSLVVEFNVWQFANREQMTSAFFDQIGAVLRREKRLSRRERGDLLWRWQRYGTYLTASQNLVELLRKVFLWTFLLSGASLLGAAALGDSSILTIPGFACLALAASLGLLADGAETILTHLRLDAYTGRRTMEELKHDLARQFQQMPRPILVVADDVDCLTPQELQEAFQLIKANADFPNFIYLLLFERAVVEANISQVLSVPGHEYVDKIVQVGFDLPAVEQPRLNKVLFDGLNRLLAEQSVAQHFSEQRWTHLFASGLQPFFHNLRQVNRFLSNLATHIALFQGKEVLEVNVVDLIGLEVLRVFEPGVYRALSSNKHLLTLSTVPRSDERRQEAEAALLSIADRAAPERREQVREVIRQLFPQAEWALGGTQRPATPEREEWYQEFRVCAGDFFERYFHFALPEGDISDEKLDRLLDCADDRHRLRAELQSLNQQGLLGLALERVGKHWDSNESNHIALLITALFDMGDELAWNRGGMFEVTPPMEATHIIDLLLWERRTSEAAVGMLRSAIEQSEGIALPVAYVAALQRSQRIAIPPEDLTALIQVCVRRIRFAARSGRLAASPELRQVLSCWKDWASSQEASEFCKQLVQSRQGAIRFVSAFLHHYVSPGLGKQGTRERSYVKLTELEQFVSCDLIERGIGSVAADAVPAMERRAVQAFRQALERRREGRDDLTPAIAFRRRETHLLASSSALHLFGAQPQAS